MEKDKAIVALKKIHSPGAHLPDQGGLKRKFLKYSGSRKFTEKGEKGFLLNRISPVPAPCSAQTPRSPTPLLKSSPNEGFKVTLGENPSIPTDADHAYEEYGLKEIAERAGAKLVDLRNGSSHCCTGP